MADLIYTGIASLDGYLAATPWLGWRWRYSHLGLQGAIAALRAGQEALGPVAGQLEATGTAIDPLPAMAPGRGSETRGEVSDAVCHGQ